MAERARRDQNAITNAILQQNADTNRFNADTRRETANAGRKPTAAQQKAFDDSEIFMAHIDNAMGLLNQNPEAVGLKNYLPNVALNTIYPEGTATRAAVSGLSATKIHEL